MQGTTFLLINVIEEGQDSLGIQSCLQNSIFQERRAVIPPATLGSVGAPDGCLLIGGIYPMFPCPGQDLSVASTL